MSIILNEYDWAEKMLKGHDLGRRPVETLGRISRYYYANQYSKNEIRRLLELFMLQCDPSVSLVQFEDCLDVHERLARARLHFNFQLGKRGVNHRMFKILPILYGM